MKSVLDQDFKRNHEFHRKHLKGMWTKTIEVHQENCGPFPIVPCPLLSLHYGYDLVERR